MQTSPLSSLINALVASIERDAQQMQHYLVAEATPATGQRSSGLLAGRPVGQEAVQHAGGRQRGGAVDQPVEDGTVPVR